MQFRINLLAYNIERPDNIESMVLGGNYFGGNRQGIWSEEAVPESLYGNTDFLKRSYLQ
ncbi:hypothetical protein [Colwellia psychrerythraea]|uniref:hypothetical protein n=1 Tax=Colwellia psychrerythraea TaxID=28229 RepID=UPI0012E092FF|nr:hypothetical protein [Colwellia psychrerythraea]